MLFWHKKSSIYADMRNSAESFNQSLLVEMNTLLKYDPKITLNVQKVLLPWFLKPVNVAICAVFVRKFMIRQIQSHAEYLMSEYMLFLISAFSPNMSAGPGTKIGPVQLIKHKLINSVTLCLGYKVRINPEDIFNRSKS